MTSSIERAWAAGFFDGEGYFGCKVAMDRRSGEPRPLRQIDLEVSQVDPRPLQRFIDAIGLPEGRLKIRTSRKATARSRETYSVHVTKFETAQYAMATLWPFLSEPKREQIVNAMSRYHALAPATR